MATDSNFSTTSMTDSLNIITTSPYDYLKMTTTALKTYNTFFLLQYENGSYNNKQLEVYISDESTYGTSTLCAATNGNNGWFSCLTPLSGYDFLIINSSTNSVINVREVKAYE